MARRDGGGRRQVVPGIRSALLDRSRQFDRAFCMAQFGDPCTWCSLIADLEAGEPVTVSGDQAWGAMASQPLTPPGAFGHLLHDVRRYRVVGPDTLEAA